MLTNYLKIAFRNLLNNKFYALLNVLGLAIGMSTCLTVILIIRDQLGYDHFHPGGERIYRINSTQGDGTVVACAPWPLGNTLLESSGAVEAATRVVRGFYGVDATTTNNLTLPLDGYFAEPSFFQVFGFALETGNAATALSEPNTLVLTRKTAQQFFGTANPVGQTLTLKNKGGVYRVTGILADPPEKSHLYFGCLASVASLAALEAALPADAPERLLDNWEDHYMTHLYVRLAPGKTKTELENTLAIAAETRAKAGKSDKDVRFFAQSLGDITPRPATYANDPTRGAPWFFIWGLLAFVALLTIFPCINYANLAVARALSRTREVGVRKAIGARNSDVRRLILAEALLTAFLALAVSGVLHLPLNHFVRRFFPSAAGLEDLHTRPADWLIFIALAVGVGLLAGWIPARRLARLQPASALRGNAGGEMPGATRFGWRTVLMIGQFSLSLVFVIVVATLWSQMRYMTLANYGFNKENLLTVELQGNKAPVLASEMAKDHRVAGVTATSVLLASNNLQGIPLRRERNSEDIGAHCASVDRNYIGVMGLELIAGENFPETAGEQREQYLILNEKAIERFQLGSPTAAIGQTLWMNDSTPLRVQGVVRDFHYRILEHAIEPFALRYAPAEHWILHVRLAPGDPGPALASLEAIWKKTDPVHPFKARFMEESIERSYTHVTFMGGLMSFFALISVSLACMGLLGIVTHTVSARLKEIGIRKVLGATTREVTLFLSRRFLILLAVATAVAIPIGYALSNLFLTLFVYRISIGWLLPGACTVALMSLALTTVGIQSLRAAIINPVKSLRNE
jgi:putative ABC transport system permease protein